MKFQIKTYMAVLLAALMLSACNKQTDADTHEHNEQEKGSTERMPDRPEKEAAIATLTEEQIRTVGIQLGRVEMKELTATIKANGMLRVPNNNKGNATSLYGGVIQTIQVQIGSHVKKGEVVATISNPQFIQLQEEYVSLGSRITLAEQEVKRQQELNDGNAGAMKNLQMARAELSAFLTRKASLHEQIQLMGINPAHVNNNNLRSLLVVTSPISGTVSNVSAKIGSYVDVSSPVIEVVDNNSLHLDLQVFEKDLPLIKVGQIIHFTLTNNPAREYDATVFSIGSSFENDSKTIAVHCKVSGNKTGLIDGMNITGIVSLNNVTTPAVPNNAIVNADGRYYLFVQTAEKAEDEHEPGDEAGSDKKEKEHPQDKVRMNFKKVEIVKGVSEMGFTAITFVTKIPANAKIATKGAFFINAKLTNTGGHEH